MDQLTALLAYGSGWGDELVRGLGLTLAIAILAYLFGTGIGFVAALGELSPLRLLAGLLTGYAAAMRSLPELLVVFFLYFGGGYLLGLLLTPFGHSGFVEVSGF